MKKIRNICKIKTLRTIIFVLVFGISFIVGSHNVVFAHSGVAQVAQAPAPAPSVSDPNKKAICEGIDLTGSTNSCDATSASGSVQKLVSSIINLLSFVVGVIAVIMIIVGGIKYVMSGGDGNSISSAKNTILYALIGLVIAMLAQVIVRFVINKV